MLTTILLLIIYMAFISLGLPDSILGVTIPALQSDWNIPLASGGVLSMCIVGGTIISSFFSELIIKKIGTGKIVFLSCLTTGFALLGFSLSPSYFWLILFAVPLGLGGGTVDVALNNYVALHFKAHHMNWLHSFWGVGATLGPVIMSWNLVNRNWQSGYRTISFIQLSLAVILFISIPVWKRHKGLKSSPMEADNLSTSTRTNLFNVPGLKHALVTMLLYCSLELGTGLWGSSFLVGFKGFTIESAARFTAIYYAGITIGRFLSGFISFKLNNRDLIRYGALTSLTGVILLLLPLPKFVVGCGLILIGIGLAPIFPSMIHETPERFGKDLSQRIIGFQMGFAYIGSAAVPPLLGVLYQKINIRFFPVTLLLILTLLILSTEILNRVVDINKPSNDDLEVV